MKEQQNIEFKQSWHDDTLKEICGFANALGGKVYVGIDNDGMVVHLSDYKPLMESIPSKIRDRLGILCEVNLQEKDGANYIEIVVQPHSNPLSLRGKYYLRSGSTNIEMTGNSLNEFLLTKLGKTWDDVIEEAATIESIDENSVQKFITDAKSSGRLPDITGLSTYEILDKLRLVENGKFKRAAIILFGKDPNRFYPNVIVKIGRFGKDDTDLRFQEVIEGNIMHLLPEVISQLGYKFLINKIEFQGMLRIEKGEYPLAALREMLLNALIHRSYTGATVQLRVYDDKISIWNEGGLPHGLTVDDLLKNHASLPRNPLIANVCFRAGYIESWGRGTQKIIATCLEAELPTPDIKENSGGMLVTLYKQSNQESNQEKFSWGVRPLKTDSLTKAIQNVMGEGIFEEVIDIKDILHKYQQNDSQITVNQVKVLNFAKTPKKRKELLETCLGITNQTKNFNLHIEPLLSTGLLQRTIKNVHNNKNQRYVTTSQGRHELWKILIELSPKTDDQNN